MIIGKKAGFEIVSKHYYGLAKNEALRTKHCDVAFVTFGTIGINEAG
jgi:hypothetical protein